MATAPGRRVGRAASLACAALMASLPLQARADACPAGHGDYTSAQAMVGKTLYEAHCAECHNDDLKGNSGPALAGADFDSYLHFTKISAAQLLHFAETQMPYQAPGSLKPDDYQNIFAYILQVNGYAAGDQALTDANARCVSMLPYPGDAKNKK